jgi:hypothetical protein
MQGAIVKFTEAKNWAGSLVKASDPRVSACNFVALIVAANQPIYLIYIWLALGTRIPTAMLTLLSMPCSLPCLGSAVDFR